MRPKAPTNPVLVDQNIKTKAVQKIIVSVLAVMFITTIKTSMEST